MAYMALFFAVFITSVLTSVTARNYSIAMAGAKLPEPLADVPAVYDGNDVIYLLGGARFNDYVDELIKYNLTSDQIEIIAIDIVPSNYGSAVMDTLNQSIYYLGGYNGFAFGKSSVWKIPVSDPQTIVNVTDLPAGCSFASSVWNQGEYIYSIGGHQDSTDSNLDTIVRFSKTRHVAEVISRTPGPVAATSAVWDPENNVAYIFGGWGNLELTNDILVFNETSGNVSKLNASLPYPLADTCAVLIGREAFIVGGFGGPINEFSFIKFGIDSHEVTSLLVENFPTRVSNVGCSYVQSSNRIYIFGGEVSGGYMNSIMYIDMSQ